MSTAEGTTPVAKTEAAAPTAGAASPCPVVGIGASAGGLEATTRMLQALPPDTGMAFVLVQHLDPSHPSMLAEIHRRSTSMPVCEATDGMPVVGNHVYVIPPNTEMSIARGVLGLSARSDALGPRRSIDNFFKSLAEDLSDRAIGVVLSGTATDGTIGLGAVKEQGGITFAQDGTAQYGSMPQSAVAAGCVDFVLPPEQIASEIGRISRHPFVAAEGARGPAEPARPEGLDGILRILRQATGVDFDHYRSSTIGRRVNRRMALHRIETYPDYLGLLRSQPAEVDALYQDVLVRVTRFFRDAEAWAALETLVLPKLLQGRAAQDTIRVWSLGCSTGEEAYSAGILYAEVAEARGTKVPIQIFATDVNGASIEKARSGLYGEGIAHDVSPERLRRWFIATDGGYRVCKQVRDGCVFAHHDVLADAPFSRIDVILCRNVLIYLEPLLQRKVLPILHYALQPGGYLLLGSSETIGTFGSLFQVEDGKQRIYSRKPLAARSPGSFATAERLAEPRAGDRASPAVEPDGAVAPEAERQVDRLLLSRFAPPGVIVSGDLEIQQFRGDTSPYVAPAPGKASLNLLKMLRGGLLVGVRAALARARREGAPAREEGLKVQLEGSDRRVDVEAVPLRHGGGQELGFLVLFQGRGVPSPLPEPSRAAAEGSAEDPDGRVARLTQELAATREYLQSVIEQQEAANEELQSANEEAQSANEELQSINEEMETSREEIQSSNEELATVNDELNNRNAELGLLNNDLTNLLASVHLPIVMLGPNLRIRRLTPMAEKLFDLLPTDVGRPLTDVKVAGIAAPELERHLREVIDTVCVRELQVQDPRGRWYSMRLRPYRTSDNRIDGAVIVWVDIDALKRAHAYMSSIVGAIDEPLLVIDAKSRVRTASPAFPGAFETTLDQVEGRSFFEMDGGRWDLPELRHLLEHIQGGAVTGDTEATVHLAGAGPRRVYVAAVRLPGSADEEWVLLNVRDVTQRRELEQSLTRQEEITRADRNKTTFIATLAHELRNPLAALGNVVRVLDSSSAGEDELRLARQMMERQVRNMARMVDDLLDLSRITKGQLRLQAEPVDLIPIIRAAVATHGPNMEERGQVLSLQLPREELRVQGDPVRLEQILGNLVNNASSHSGHRATIRVSAEVAEGDAGAREVLVRVRDDGQGIPPEILPKVFDMFVQGESTLDRPHGGLGIGLTLVRTLVELHGGRVEARSDGAGKGSEFTVRLPALAPAKRTPAPRTVRDPAEAAGPLGPARIVIVEDNRDVAESMAMLLRLAGHEVLVAAHGRAALDVVAAFLPDLMLIDVGLPGMDGYELARRLRGLPELAETRLVALSGYGQAGAMRLAREAGIDAYYVKPIRPADLASLLSTVPRRRRS